MRNLVTRRGPKRQLPITVSQHEDKTEYKRQYSKLKKKSPAKNRTEWLWWKYKLTDEDYNLMLQEQNNACAICETTDTGGHKHFHVDHEHASNKVRGLLCHKCNKALGLFKDNTDYLRKAIQYLNK